jgi:hypothetical protein
VISTVPDDLAEDVPINDNITATFSEVMDPATIAGDPSTTFTVYNETLVADVAGKVTYAGTTATFDPTGDLEASSDFTATITTGATDLAGNALASDREWTFSTGETAHLGPNAPNLGTAATYGIMSSSATTGPSSCSVDGDVALQPGTEQGIPDTSISGHVHINDSESNLAKIDLLAAYNEAKALAPGTVKGTLNGQTLAPGTYTSGSTMLIDVGPGTDLTLNGGPNDVWVFQIGSSLTANGNVLLTGGAVPENVFWVPTADATIGVSAVFNGTILAGRDVTAKTSSRIYGRILAGAIGAATVAVQENAIIDVP